MERLACDWNSNYTWCCYDSRIKNVSTLFRVYRERIRAHAHTSINKNKNDDTLIVRILCLSNDSPFSQTETNKSMKCARSQFDRLQHCVIIFFIHFSRAIFVVILCTNFCANKKYEFRSDSFVQLTALRTCNEQTELNEMHKCHFENKSEDCRRLLGIIIHSIEINFREIIVLHSSCFDPLKIYELGIVNQKSYNRTVCGCLCLLNDGRDKRPDKIRCRQQQQQKWLQTIIYN